MLQRRTAALTTRSAGSTTTAAAAICRAGGTATTVTSADHRCVYLATRLVPGGACEVVRAVPASDGGFQIAEEEASGGPAVLRLRGGVGPGDVLRLSARWLDQARPRPAQELPISCVDALLHAGPARCEERADRLHCRHLAECDRCPFAIIACEASAAAAVRLAKQLLQRAGFPTARRAGGRAAGSTVAIEDAGHDPVALNPPLFHPAPSAATAAPRRVTRLYRGVTVTGDPAFGLRQRRAVDAAASMNGNDDDDELLVGARGGHGAVVDEFAIPRGGAAAAAGSDERRGVVETATCAVASRGARAALECLNRLLRHPQPGRRAGVEMLACVDVLDDAATGGYAVYVFTSNQLGQSGGGGSDSVQAGRGFDTHELDEALRGCSPGGRPVTVFAADVTNRGGLRLLGDERWRPATGRVTVYTPSGQRSVPYPLLPNAVVPATPSLQGGADLLVTGVAHLFRSAGHALAAARGRRVAVFPATDGALAHGVADGIAHDVATSKLVRKLCPPTIEGPRRARATIALHATENIAAIGKRWIMRHGREQQAAAAARGGDSAGSSNDVNDDEKKLDVLHLNTEEFDSRKAAGAGFTLVFDAAQHGRGRRLPLRLRHSADAAVVIVPGSSTPDEIRTAWFDAVDRDAKPPSSATVVCHDPTSDDFLIVLSSV